jgi:hypothetical protein
VSETGLCGVKLSESKAKDGVGGWADGQLLDSSFGPHIGHTILP